MLRRAEWLASCASLITQRAAKILSKWCSDARMAAEPTDDSTGVAVMQASSPEQQVGRDSRSARRRLLRGAFSAPAVLTVCSGSVAASSIGACLVKGVPVGADPAVSTVNTDVLLRIQLWGLVNNGGNVSSYWVRRADLPTVQTVISASFNYREFNITTNALASNQTNLPPTQAQRTFQAVQAYAVVRVDSTGAVVGIGGTGTGGLTTDSCWTSFTMASTRTP